MHDLGAPIVAVATAPGRGAVGIVRISGRGLMPLARRLCGRELTPRHAHYGPFLDAQGQALDRGLALFFAAPHSFTGEDVLELQAHGGPVVLQLLLARCLQAAQEPQEPQVATSDAQVPTQTQALLPGLRLATPGEFSQRAFLNDKIDLAQAEAIADLIDASTEAAARSATRSMEGAFSREVDALHEQIVALRMLVEATLDFPEEEIDFLQQAKAVERLAALQQTLARLLGQARQGALLREGLRVVLAGQPNVGKSSLLNALAGAELAIVTPIAGTTRDRLSQTIQIEGVPLHIVDTAGLRAQQERIDEVERIGVQRSWQAIEQADAVLFMHDLTRMGQPDYDQAEAAIAQRLPAGVTVLEVFNKADACAALPTPAEHPGALRLSVHAGQGLAELRHRLLEIAGWQPGAEGVFMARARHLKALQDCALHLQQAWAMAEAGLQALELLAEELRLAHEGLGRITGSFSADDLLGEIFARFCIGK